MGKILLISDTHRDDETFSDIKRRHKDACLMIHAGDSCLSPEDQLLEGMIVVKGNHDFQPFPEFVVHPPFFICHGHTFGIYQTFDKVIEAAKKNHCRIVIHGHTHIAYDKVHEGIRIINPGSAMFNRGNYGYGTYALLDSETEVLTFFHHTTHKPVNEIVIPDGRETLAQFRQLLSEF